jgi:hypothetical protein
MPENHSDPDKNAEFQRKLEVARRAHKKRIERDNIIANQLISGERSTYDEAKPEWINDMAAILSAVSHLEPLPEGYSKKELQSLKPSQAAEKIEHLLVSTDYFEKLPEEFQMRVEDRLVETTRENVTANIRSTLEYCKWG